MEQLPRTEGNFSVHRYWPADFLFRFSSRRFRHEVASAGVVDRRGFTLRFAPWNRQLQAVRCTMRQRVQLELSGIPVHAWSRTTAGALLGTTAWIEGLSSSTVSRDDLRTFYVTAWVDDPSASLRRKRCGLKSPTTSLTVTMPSSCRARRRCHWRKTCSSM